MASLPRGGPDLGGARHRDVDREVVAGAHRRVQVDHLHFREALEPAHPSKDVLVPDREALALLDDLAQKKAARVVPGHGPHAMELPEALTPSGLALLEIGSDQAAGVAELVRRELARIGDERLGR